MIKTNVVFKPEDFDKHGNLKKSAILLYMQEAAIKDATQYGATRDNLLSDNMFFAVYRNTLKLSAPITSEFKEMVLITFQSSHDRMRFMRSYFMYLPQNVPDISGEFDPYKNSICYCNSIWVLMDFEKRSLLKASALNYPIEECTIPYERPFKVLMNADKAEKVGEFRGVNYYIDANNHVNNASYADIADDFSSVETSLYFDVTYEHEIFKEETVEVFSEKTDEGEKLFGIRVSDSANCFSAEFKK